MIFPPLELIEIEARKEGLSFLGAVPLEKETYFNHYKKWLEAGYHAKMAFLEKNLEQREDPRKISPPENLKTALVFGLNYYVGEKSDKSTFSYKIAQYAGIRDYHQLFKTKLTRIWEKIITSLNNKENISCKIIVDSGPLLEKSLAVQTRAGFFGKNSCFIHQSMGSFLVLGEILTTLDIPSQQKSEENVPASCPCGCQKCQEACPTGAIFRDYFVDSSKCLSYLTIENREIIPEIYWPFLNDYIFGCDRCQLVCPFNQGLSPSDLASKEKINELSDIPLPEIATMDQERYQRFFSGSALVRAKREGLMRNSLVMMCVRDHPDLEKVLEKLKNEENKLVQNTIFQIKKYRTC